VLQQCCLHLLLLHLLHLKRQVHHLLLLLPLPRSPHLLLLLEPAPAAYLSLRYYSANLLPQPTVLLHLEHTCADRSTPIAVAPAALRLAGVPCCCSLLLLLLGTLLDPRVLHYPASKQQQQQQLNTCISDV
jgi:hypothetical protein